MERAVRFLEFFMRFPGRDLLVLVTLPLMSPFNRYALLKDVKGCGGSGYLRGAFYYRDLCSYEFTTSSGERLENVRKILDVNEYRINAYGRNKRKKEKEAIFKGSGRFNVLAAKENMETA